MLVMSRVLGEGRIWSGGRDREAILEAEETVGMNYSGGDVRGQGSRRKSVLACKGRAESVSWSG